MIKDETIVADMMIETEVEIEVVADIEVVLDQLQDRAQDLGLAQNLRPGRGHLVLDLDLVLTLDQDLVQGLGQILEDLGLLLLRGNIGKNHHLDRNNRHRTVVLLREKLLKNIIDLTHNRSDRIKNLSAMVHVIRIRTTRIIIRRRSSVIKNLSDNG